MITFICNKLGRDKGLEGFKSENIVLHYKILSGAELCTALKNKIVEEAHEVNEASTQQELIAELADVLEVVDGLCKVYGISANDLQLIKKEKKQERGSFEKGLYIETIEMNDDNPKVQHFRASPTKYPEI
ncbi:MAG: hypothetical protein BWY54_00301 [Candidatus Dependentiae bacterium ADurb.Bin331]|nr:MAG: hypothetical protein BWY54_00301 [Candidatus Dependentiae bacterium ADurb.Bin331]